MPRLYKYIKIVTVLFGVILVTLFIQHHREFRDLSRIPSGSSDTDVYYPPNIEERGKITSREEIKKYYINVRLSDDIPLNREIPDSRPESCQETGSISITLAVSIVITFFKEWPSILLRTLYSIVNKSQNIKEIVLVDDGNNDTMYDEVLQYIYNKFGHLVKIVKLTKRFGLIGARLEGVKHVTGDVICFLDSHMEVNRNWLPPLLEVLQENPKAVAMSQLDTIERDTLVYEFSNTYRTRYGFDWNLRFFETEFRQDQLKQGDLILPGVIAVGSAFVIRTDFFKDIGMYDPGLKIWGGENLELSFKVWLCGGELIHVACSRIGHITRSQPYLRKHRLDIEMYNYKRVADVWMDDYAKYVHDHYPKMTGLEVGNLDKQTEMRKRCKPFTWFLDNIWPELFRYRDTHITTSGNIMIKLHNTNMCLDNDNHLFSSEKRLVVKPCVKDLDSQMFALTNDGRLRTNLQCVVGKTKLYDFLPYLQNCLEPPLDTFIYKNTNIIHKKTNLCLTLGANNLMFEKCRFSKNQKWKFDSFPFQNVK